MRLEPLYRLTFDYRESWLVELEADTERFLIAEGRVEGRIAGRMRGANRPRRRADLTYLPDFDGAIETDDGATILFNLQGRGRPHEGSVVGFATHVASENRYRWLNDAVCAVVGAIREDDIVLDVARLVWEPLPERPGYDLADGN